MLINNRDRKMKDEKAEVIEMNEDCQFLKDLTTDINKRFRNYNLGLWNLSLSIRDLRLYTKGIKPHRAWKISDLKRYFGMNGNKDDLLNKLLAVRKILKEGENKNVGKA